MSICLTRPGPKAATLGIDNISHEANINDKCHLDVTLGPFQLLTLDSEVFIDLLGYATGLCLLLQTHLAVGV